MMRIRSLAVAAGCLVALGTVAPPPAAAQNYGTETTARPQDWPGIEATFHQADVSLPAGFAGLDKPFVGKMAEARRLPGLATAAPIPVILFLHGSSGLGPGGAAIQKWAAEEAKIAFVAPDSMVLPGRLKYTSPVGKDVYEKVHALRQSEIRNALDHFKELPWIDAKKLILAGASEGGMAAARWRGPEFAGRMIYAWSCEMNYFVELATTGVRLEEPVLNVISTRDPFFGPDNPWNTPYRIKGHCGDALRFHKAAQIVLLPHAGHNVLAEPQTTAVSLAFLRQVLGGR